MALDLTKLKRIGGQDSRSPTIWTYHSGADAGATLDTAAYFSLAADKLKVNDLIMFSPTAAPGGVLQVRTNTRDLTANPPVFGVVDTVDFLTFGSGNAD